MAQRGRYPTLVAGAYSIEYQTIAGDPERPTLVLLHEGLGCVALWRDFPARLAAASGHPVFVFSRPGYGGSSPVELPRPLDYMTIEARETLPRVLSAAGIERFILIGHSDGASIALIYAGLFPDQGVEALVLIAPHVFAEPEGVRSIAAINAAYRASDLHSRLVKYHGDNAHRAFRGWTDSWLHPGFGEWNIESFLDTVAVPVLLLQGEDDEYGSVEQLRRIERGIRGPVKTRLFYGCGHAPQFDRPQATLHAMLEFIRQAPGAPCSRRRAP